MGLIPHTVLHRTSLFFVPAAARGGRLTCVHSQEKGERYEVRRGEKQAYMLKLQLFVLAILVTAVPSPCCTVNLLTHSLHHY